MKFLSFFCQLSFNCGLLLCRSSSATLCLGTGMIEAHRHCGSPVERPATLHGLRWHHETPSSSCWWSSPSAGCYWHRLDQFLYPWLFLLMKYLLLAGLPGSILVCTYFLYRFILTVDVHQSSRLGILHSAINLECHAKAGNCFLTLGWWCNFSETYFQPHSNHVCACKLVVGQFTLLS
jgi:hypothetical protein